MTAMWCIFVLTYKPMNRLFAIFTAIGVAAPIICVADTFQNKPPRTIWPCPIGDQIVYSDSPCSVARQRFNEQASGLRQQGLDDITKALKSEQIGKLVEAAKAKLFAPSKPNEQKAGGQIDFTRFLADPSKAQKDLRDLAESVMGQNPELVEKYRKMLNSTQ